MVIVLLIAVLFLAFSNGANDNFKGVATLLGSKTTNYKFALTWATLTTMAGSLAAIFLAQKLITLFSGKGLVPDQIVQMGSFSASVAAAAATTVFLATRLGFPISTTHAITCALVGSGYMASADGVNLSKLISTFFMPLIVSPFIAIISALLLYPLFSMVRRKLRVARESCLCIGREVLVTSAQGLSHGSSTAAMVQIETLPTMSFGTTVTCEQRYVGKMLGLDAKMVLDVSHFVSSGLVSFARGLNDTPKIAAILLVGGTLGPISAIGTVGLAIALGGILMAKRIAETMSYNITEMNDGQGFTANFITSLVVLGASQLGMPVSTTHVSCGALFGIGTITKKAHWGSIMKIVMSWVITLPTAAALGYICFALLKGFN